MPEKRTIVEKELVEYICDKCKEGTLTGIEVRGKYYNCIPRIPHTCKKCGDQTIHNVCYPYLVTPSTKG